MMLTFEEESHEIDFEHDCIKAHMLRNTEILVPKYSQVVHKITLCYLLSKFYGSLFPKN